MRTSLSSGCSTRLINPEEMVKAALAALVQEREVYCTQFRGADYFYCNY